MDRCRHVMGGIMGVLLFWLFVGPTWAQAPTPDPFVFGHTVERGDLAAIQRWLDQGLDPEYQAAQIGTGLMVAAWNGNIDMMALFVERGADVRRSNRYGEQPLQLAAWNGHREAVQWLLAHGAPLDRQGPEWGALHYAVFNGHGQVVGDLLARGANVNARSPNGSTPLMLAAREGREQLVPVLLEAGADTNAQSDWGDTALTLAMRYDHYRLAKMIASPAEFAIAVKAPKESFGQASRSTSAPDEIEEILKQIRAAEAEGRPSADLHKKLLAAVRARRVTALPLAQRPMPRPYQPRSMIITARRTQPGAERAQLVVDGSTAGTEPKATSPNAATAVGKAALVKSASAGTHRAAVTHVSDLLRQVRLLEAQGRPAEELRQQLYRAVDALER